MTYHVSEKKVGCHEKFVDIIEKPTWKLLLIEIVHKENMDPWDIDIVLLTQRYIEKVNAMQKVDFRIPANAVLACSILMHFKADAWDLYHTARQLQLPEQIDYSVLSENVPELTATRRLPSRKVSLEELIKAIEDVMAKEKKKARQYVPQPLGEVMLRRAFLDQEEFTRMADEVMRKIGERKDEQNLVLYSQLLDEKTRTEAVKVLISLLHLANKHKVLVWQEEHFKEIFVELQKEQEAEEQKKLEAS